MEIAYLMHVPWNWIKQRPHFLAEGLAKKCQVKVFYKFNYRQKNLVQNAMPSSIRRKALFVLPFERFDWVKQINLMLMRFQLKKPIGPSSVIWVPDPYLFETIHDLVGPDNFIVYDCMDDALSFPLVAGNPQRKKTLMNMEAVLCAKSDQIFTSSANLRDKLVARYHVDPAKIKVVNNAAAPVRGQHPSTRADEVPSYLPGTPSLKMVYVGTIAEWFDFEMILMALQRFEQIECWLVGPCETEIPSHDRIKVMGPMPHGAVFDIMNQSDVLIMPFQATELIMSVNPVKLYEYIYSGKPVIALRYAETLSFEEYVYLYGSREEFLGHLEALVMERLPAKKSLEACIEFHGRNTWEHRVGQIMACLPEDHRGD